MKLSRRKFMHAAASAAVVPTGARVASASDYPSRPVHLIIGYPPAGSADMTARLTAQWLSERLGQQFIVESRPGAATNIATESVLRSAPDGYTLLLAAPANATNVALFAQLNFDFIRDITPIAGIIRFPDVVDVNLSVPVHSIPELISYAKANPGKLNFASGSARRFMSPASYSR
jgi:tripartite-type tricarboxylate transporter receptor subunit TctC